jgi:hypothetical protein
VHLAPPNGGAGHFNVLRGQARTGALTALGTLLRYR